MSLLHIRCPRWITFSKRELTCGEQTKPAHVLRFRPIILLRIWVAICVLKWSWSELVFKVTTSMMNLSLRRAQESHFEIRASSKSSSCSVSVYKPLAKPAWGRGLYFWPRQRFFWRRRNIITFGCARFQRTRTWIHRWLELIHSSLPPRRNETVRGAPQHLLHKTGATASFFSNSGSHYAEVDVAPAIYLRSNVKELVS